MWRLLPVCVRVSRPPLRRRRRSHYKLITRDGRTTVICRGVRLTRYCVLARLRKSANYPKVRPSVHRPLMDPKNAERLLPPPSTKIFPGTAFAPRRQKTTYTIYRAALSAPGARTMNFCPSVWHNLSDKPLASFSVLRRRRQLLPHCLLARPYSTTSELQHNHP